MKFKYLIASLAAAAALFVSCTQELQPVSTLTGLEVSNDYVTIPTEGTAVTISVTGEEAWKAEVPEKATWLTVSPTTGAAGQKVNVSLSATASTAARSAELKIVMGSKVKYINVNQEAPVGVEVPASTVKEVMDGPDKTYKVTGKVTKITGTNYGNWYLNDGTSDKDLYIYGTCNKKGATFDKTKPTMEVLNCPANPDAWELAVGDEVTIEGPKTVYNGTVELVDVTIIKIVKSLIKVEPADVKLKYTDSTFVAKVQYSGDSFEFESNVDWLSVVGQSKDADTTFLKVHATKNTAPVSRTGAISLKSKKGEASSEVFVNVTQEGDAKTVTVSEMVTLADNTGVITKDPVVVAAVTTKGFVATDGKAAIYVYGYTNGVAIGDQATFTAIKKTYNGVPELDGVDKYKKVSSGTTMTYPEPRDITATFDSYTASVAEFISFTGTLKKSGNYYNVNVEGATKFTGSVANPTGTPAIDGLADKVVTFTGFYNGVSGGKYHNIIIVSAVEYVAPAPTLDICEQIFVDAGYKMEDYDHVAITWTHNGYYNSTGGSTIKTSEGNSDEFAATQTFHRSKLPVGSVIVIQGATSAWADGWMYRPEGWSALTTNTSSGNRPKNVTGKSKPITVVDDAWWDKYNPCESGNASTVAFNYRAFNVARVGNPHLTAEQQEELEHVFGIFIPKPYASTDAIMTAKGYDLTKYTKLEFTYTEKAFYNSTSDTNSSLVTSGSNVNQFVATNIVEKSKIPNGSVIVVNYGYQYRPEGWQTLGSKNTASRPGNVGNTVTVVDDAWWGNFNYRGFNLAKFGNPGMTDAEQAATKANFAVYVPKN